MAENKTKPTSASVKDYIASRANDEQSKDSKALMALFKKVTGKPPKMWGPSIVGYGSYRYTYDTGRTGEMCLAGFAIRGREFVVYLIGGGDKQEGLLGKLGKYKKRGSCLYFKKVADIDTAVLGKLLANSIAETKRRYQ